MTAGQEVAAGHDPTAFAAWLRLREPADAMARATEVLEPVRRRLGAGPTVIHDLGAGTGSMARWLAPRLPGAQHWILYDRDPALLARARARTAGLTAADGAPVTVATRRADVTRLTAADLAGATLVTASALLDLLTAEEVERVVAACVGRPALLTLTVVGRVELTPPDPLDDEVARAFNDHQRRTVAGRTLLGPDALDACAAAFARHGGAVTVRPSPWRLGPRETELAAEWFTGWLDAARAQRPDLAGPASAYGRRRLAQARTGRLGVLVDHRDLFVDWG